MGRRMKAIFAGDAGFGAIILVFEQRLEGRFERNGQARLTVALPEPGHRRGQVGTGGDIRRLFSIRPFHLPVDCPLSPPVGDGIPALPLQQQATIGRHARHPVLIVLDGFQQKRHAFAIDILHGPDTMGGEVKYVKTVRLAVGNRRKP